MDWVGVVDISVNLRVCTYFVYEKTPMLTKQMCLNLCGNLEKTNGKT